MAEPDKALAERAAEGDRAAFGELVERHILAVAAFALAAVGNREEARDIAQEAFIEAYGRLGELRSPGSFRAWVCGIARRKAIYLVRRRSKHAEVPGGLDVGAGMLSHEEGPAEAAESAEARLVLVAAVAGLEETTRTAVLLRYVADLSFREIGEVMSMSEDAVEKRISRAKDVLREQLDGLLT